MHQAAQAYGKIAQKVATPRELEANLLLKAAAQLQSVHDAWESSKPKLDEALLFNRRLWALFMGSVAETDSPLPREIRQNIANLGMFVLNQTLSLMTEPKPEKLNILISINREIATGLLNHA
jgi:flagellar protein FlaF